ncbi:hypothetical protein DL93DRAFT_2091515, partial [Clavulina sp. PMI_390]
MSTSRSPLFTEVVKHDRFRPLPNLKDLQQVRFAMPAGHTPSDESLETIATASSSPLSSPDSESMPDLEPVGQESIDLTHESDGDSDSHGEFVFATRVTRSTSKQASQDTKPDLRSANPFEPLVSLKGETPPAVQPKNEGSGGVGPSRTPVRENRKNQQGKVTKAPPASARRNKTEKEANQSGPREVSQPRRSVSPNPSPSVPMRTTPERPPVPKKKSSSVSAVPSILSYVTPPSSSNSSTPPEHLSPPASSSTASAPPQMAIPMTSTQAEPHRFPPGPMGGAPPVQSLPYIPPHRVAQQFPIQPISMSFPHVMQYEIARTQGALMDFARKMGIVEAGLADLKEKSGSAEEVKEKLHMVQGAANEARLANVAATSARELTAAQTAALHVLSGRLNAFNIQLQSMAERVAKLEEDRSSKEHQLVSYRDLKVQMDILDGRLTREIVSSRRLTDRLLFDVNILKEMKTFPREHHALLLRDEDINNRLLLRLKSSDPHLLYAQTYRGVVGIVHAWQDHLGYTLPVPQIMSEMDSRRGPGFTDKATAVYAALKTFRGLIDAARAIRNPVPGREALQKKQQATVVLQLWCVTYENTKSALIDISMAAGEMYERAGERFIGLQVSILGEVLKTLVADAEVPRVSMNAGPLFAGDGLHPGHRWLPAVTFHDRQYDTDRPIVPKTMPLPHSLHSGIVMNTFFKVLICVHNHVVSVYPHCLRANHPIVGPRSSVHRLVDGPSTVAVECPNNFTQTSMRRAFIDWLQMEIEAWMKDLGDLQEVEKPARLQEYCETYSSVSRLLKGVFHYVIIHSWGIMDARAEGDLYVGSVAQLRASLAAFLSLQTDKISHWVLDDTPSPSNSLLDITLTVPTLTRRAPETLRPRVAGDGVM